MGKEDEKKSRKKQQKIASIELSKDFGQVIKNLRNTTQNLADALTVIIPKIEFPRFDPKVLNRLKYVQILADNKWPLYFELEDSLVNNIIETSENKNDAPKREAIKEIIFEYCNEAYIYNIKENWGKCTQIDSQRHPIINEALDLHLLKKYYASTSILMCQLYGIARDINIFAKDNDLHLTDKEKARIKTDKNIANITSEKGILFQIFELSSIATLIWDAVGIYFKNEIVCSSDSKERWKHQPVRNKICHGDQLNYGTKEHSLKAILCIDILIKLTGDIEKTIKVISDSRDYKSVPKRN